MIKNFFTKFFKQKEAEIVKMRNVEEFSAIPQKTLNTNFQKITAKQIAADNGILYISNAIGRKLPSTHGKINRFCARKGKYILLYPANDPMRTCPFEWWGKFNGTRRMILNNQHSYNCISNLNEIIMQMIELYTKYIDENVLISSSDFALKLEDEVQPHYHGKASLVLTKNSIHNGRTAPEELLESKKYFINDFLDHYIGWNFGVVIKNNTELEKALIDFNNLVIEKGLREYLDIGVSVWQSQDVVCYNLKPNS